MSFEVQIISKDKYPSIFLGLNYPSNIFRKTRSFENFGISLKYSPVLAGAVFSHVTSLDQSRAQ